MRISDWSSDLCSSDLWAADLYRVFAEHCGWRGAAAVRHWGRRRGATCELPGRGPLLCRRSAVRRGRVAPWRQEAADRADRDGAAEAEERQMIDPAIPPRSEEHTSELQSLLRLSYAVFCLKKKKQN